jgi:hypothetical protein
MTGYCDINALELRCFHLNNAAVISIAITTDFLLNDGAAGTVISISIFTCFLLNDGVHFAIIVFLRIRWAEIFNSNIL